MLTAKDVGRGGAPPIFEALEKRLLLSTLIGGDSFIFRNSQGDLIRINLIDEPSNAAIEVLSYAMMGEDEPLEVLSMPGIYWRDADGDGEGDGSLPGGWDEIAWPDGSSVVEELDEEEFDWFEYQEPDEDGAGEVRGIDTEIYSIYIGNCGPQTILTIGVLASQTLFDLEDPRWDTGLATWGSSNLPILDRLSQGGQATDILSPGGSGSVLVGGYQDPLSEGDELTFIRFEAVQDDSPVSDDDDVPIEIPAIGVFPGGLLYPGITVSPDVFVSAPGGGDLGAQVRAVADSRTGGVSAVDGGVFQAVLANTYGASLGLDVHSLAVDFPLVLYAVDNDPESIGEELGSVLVRSSYTGAVTQIGLLTDATDSTIVYENVFALDFDNSETIYGTLYAVGEAAAPSTLSGLRLLTIEAGWKFYADALAGWDPETEDQPTRDETDTSDVTDIGEITGLSHVSAIVFDSNDILYAVDSDADKLYTINTTTAVPSEVATLTGADGDIVGIEFVTVDGNELLYGVTDSTLYVINTATGVCTELDGTGRSDLTSLGLNNISTPWSLWTASGTSENGYDLRSLELASTLVTYDEDLLITTHGPKLFDSDEPTFTIKDVHGLDYDAADVLYGIGTIVNLDPINAGPAPSGLYLVTIDTDSGEFTRVVLLDGVDTLSTLAFDLSATLYGVNPDTDELLTVEPSTGATTVIGTLTDASTLETVTGIVGIDFLTATGAMYAVTSDTFYSVDPATAECTELTAIDLAGTDVATGLADDPFDSDMLWVTVGSSGSYRLIKLGIDPDEAIINMGRIIVDGTIAGIISTGGDVDLIEMGFMWGNAHIGKNLGDIIMREGGGARPLEGNAYLEPDNGSLITVEGTLNMADARGGADNWLHTAIQVENSFEVDDPSTAIDELEVSVDDDPPWTEEAIEDAWLAGDLVYYDNDTMARAQFLTHPTGSFAISGSLADEELSLNPNGESYAHDWYAIGLMAGQTIMIGGVRGRSTTVAHLYDLDGLWMDSFGYETTEDYGVGSRGVWLKPMTFTAPAAGIYYLGVMIDPLILEQLGETAYLDSGASYSLSVVNGPAGSLGGLNVDGSYYGRFNGTGPKGSQANITVKNGGDLSGVAISQSSYYTFAYAASGGDLVAFQAGELGTQISGEYTSNTIKSDSNIGRVASTWGFLDASINAGAAGGFYNYDAYIQNISAATDYRHEVASISATGSIGVIDIGGTLHGIDVTANSDNAGPGSSIDLIHIGGDFGGLDASIGIPTLRHGLGGDVGYVYVEGTIYVDYGMFLGPVSETPIISSVLLNDDSGGQLRVTLQLEDELGQPITPIPTGSFAYIPVDDSEGGIGGVIARLRINGSASFGATGVVQISDLDLTGADADTEITIGGSGEAHIYYVHEDDGQSIGSLSNTTAGGLVSGSLAGSIESVHVGGSLGPQTGSTGAWLHGANDAPTSADITLEPQFGWFHNTINGLEVLGDLEDLWVGESLGDLRVIGTIGTVRVNADGITQPYKWNSWAGVRGLIWSQTRIEDINVGDGLADDGGSDRAVSAIMSTGSIGVVRVSGPYYEIDPPSNATIDDQLAGSVAFKQLNGSIFGSSDEWIDGVDVLGNPILVYTEAVGLVRGTNGAVNTALIGGTGLDSFQCFKEAGFVFSGGVGTVNFTGVAAEINGSEIFGNYVRKVSTSADSYGISHSYISVQLTASALDPLSPLYGVRPIGQVEAGGPGMYDCALSTNGGSIGVVRGVGPYADIRDSSFISTNGMNSISARDIYNNGIHMPGTVGTIAATRHITENHPSVGAITKVTAGGDFLNNEFIIAGVLGSMDIKGRFDSSLTMSGPTTAYLKSLKVTGNIAGTIVSAGRIGSIVSRTGSITADISTLKGGWNNDVDLIQTAQGYTGSLNLAGSLKRFISYVSLGDDPASAGGDTQVFNIWGNLDYLRVGVSSGTTADLFAGINVGGNIGTVEVKGTFYANMFANGDLKKLTISEGLGGLITLQEDWSGEDEDSWADYWGFDGDTGQLRYLDIYGDRGFLMGESASDGTVVAYTVANPVDVDQSVLFNISGDDMAFGLMARRSDGNSDTYYLARVVSGAAGSNSLRIYKVVDGVMTELADTLLTYATAGTDYKMRFSCQTNGSKTDLKVKMWAAAGSEPAGWAVEVSDDESSLQGLKGRFGLYYGLSGALYTVTDDYSATYKRGSIDIFGNIGTMKFRTDSDMFADLTCGGSIKKLTFRGGSIIGDITSRYGSLKGISLKNGSIVGNLTAASFGKITVTGGSITGDITATNGNIKSLSIKYGNLDANVTAENGRIEKLSLSSGWATAGHTLFASGGFGKVSIKYGNLAADLVSDWDIKTLTVKGGDVTGMISAETEIRSLTVSGSIVGTTIRSGGTIKKLTVGSLVNSIISSAWNMERLTIKGNVTNSYILAGFDVGQDGLMNTADDNPLNGGVVHSGNIKSLKINGVLSGSVVAAGIDGGTNGYLDQTDNSEAAGESSIKKMKVKGGYANVAAIAVLADTAIYQKFAAEAAAVGVLVDSGVTTLENGSGTDFGPNTLQGKKLIVGELTLSLNFGRANYNPGTGELVLESTTARSKLIIKYTGLGTYLHTISLTGSDDSGLSGLSVKGNVTLGDMAIDGGLKSLRLGAVEAGSTWTLPGGVRSAKLETLLGVDVSVGQVNSWKMKGAYTSGNFTADAIKSFYTSGTMGGDLIVTLGGATKVYIRGGNLDGDMTVRGTVKSLYVSLALTGDVLVTNGDLLTVKVGSLSGTVEVTGGQTKSLTITAGDFGGGDNTSYRTATGIRKFKVSRGNFSGLLSTRGDLRTLSVSKGEMSGRVWSGGTIRSMTVGNMNGAIVAASGDFLKAKIKGDMWGSYIFAGFDPGDAGFDPLHGGEAANIQIDAFTVAGWQTAENTDHSYGGTIKKVTIYGDMGRHGSLNLTTRRMEYTYDGSTISAGVGPGPDGYFGTNDDVVAGTGYINRVTVKGGIYGTFDADESYGIFAANSMPQVVYLGKQPFLRNYNAYVGTMASIAGNLTITDVSVYADRLTVWFNHTVNMGTIDENSFRLLVSTDWDFDPLVDTNVSADTYSSFTYDDTDYSVTLRLDSGGWQLLGLGNYYQLTIDGSTVTDNRGNLLDGEFSISEALPSGDHVPGGNFVYEYALEPLTISGVPAYESWFGRSPTAGGMLVGYYDGMEYVDLIPGDASTQTDQVNEAIASSGDDGQYEGDGTVVVAGTLGTGHIPDYALYDEYNDYDDSIPYPDMSDPDVVADEGVNPHDDDSIADFMQTSRSHEGLGMGGSGFGDIGPGIEGYFDYKGYWAVSQRVLWSDLKWEMFMNEINEGRPMLLGVDADGDGTVDHSIIAIGYNMVTRQYAFYDTRSDDTDDVRWYDFQGVTVGENYGIADAVLVNVDV